MIFLLLIVVLVAVLVAQKDNGIDAARNAYLDALSRLKAEPANPDLREETLRLGRAYSSLTRADRRATLFDEVALMNDINAACAAATAPPQVVAPPPSASVEDRLTRLHELKTRGVISEAECDARRREILREV